MADDEAKVRVIHVKTHPDEGEHVGLADRWPTHPPQEGLPTGEIYVAGQDQEPVAVDADAPAVVRALAQKRLIVVVDDEDARAAKGRRARSEPPTQTAPPTPPRPPPAPTPSTPPAPSTPPPAPAPPPAADAPPSPPPAQGGRG